MKGTVIKRGNSWQYSFDLGKVDGVRKRKSKSGFKTKREAEIALNKELARFLDTGVDHSMKDITLSEYLDEWFSKYVNNKLKYRSRNIHNGHCVNYIKPHLGNFKLSSITTSMCQDFLLQISNVGLSKNSVKNIMSTLRSALDYAVEPLQYIRQNPCVGVKYPVFQPGTSTRTVIPYENFKQIIDRFPEGSSFYVPLMIGYYTGLRISECYALCWDDIDLDNRIITVRHQVVKMVDGKEVRESIGKMSSWYLQSPKSLKSCRKVPFGDTLYEVLRTASLNKKKNRLQYGEHFIEYYKKKELDINGLEVYRLVFAERCISSIYEPADLVNVREDGYMLTSDSFRYCTKVVRLELGLDFNYHSMRHTHGTILAENGAPIKDIQERLGHNNVQTTLNNYIHATEEMSRQSVETFEQYTRSS